MLDENHSRGRSALFQEQNFGTPSRGLIATGFKDSNRAAEVLNRLQRGSGESVRGLDRAVVVRHEGAEQIKVQFCLDLNSLEESLWARLWGSFLSLALLFPAADAMVDAAMEFAAVATSGQTASVRVGRRLPDVKWWREQIGITEEFIRDVGGMIQPGDSALFMLLPIDDMGTLLRELRDQGGTPLHISFSPEQNQLLDKVLTAKMGH